MALRHVGFAIAACVSFAGSAHAANTVDVIWTGTTGSGTPGNTSIEAKNGDVLTAEVWLTVDAAGVQFYSLSAEFDQALDDELDLLSATAYTPPPPLGACGSLSTQESSGSQVGRVSSFCGYVLGAGPVSTSFAIGEIELEVKNIDSDGSDVFSLAYNYPALDEIYDNSSTDVTPSTTFNHAAVNAGYPTVPFAADSEIGAPVGGLATAIFAADIDGDGDLDAVGGECVGDLVVWYESDGGSPLAFTARTINTVASCPEDVHAADLDADGDQDVLSASDDGEVYWYENDGTPAVGTWTARSIVARNIAIEALALDVDGDGDLDVVAAFAGSTQAVAWYRNDGGSPLSFVAQTDIATGSFYIAVDAGDFDGDGVMDLVSAGNGGELSWHENENGDGSSWWTRSISHTGTGNVGVGVGDMDGDGDLDILSVASDEDLVAWYENDGASPPGFTERVVTDTGFSDSPRDVLAADLDGDGDLDVVAASGSDDTIAWFENLDGSATSWDSRNISTTTDSFIDEALVAVDFDGDGDLDILSADATDSRFSWHENIAIHGRTRFVSETEITTGSDETRVVLGDIDGDSDLDQVVTRRGDGEVVWLENDNGDASSWSENSIATGESQPLSVELSDLDRDGDLDVIVGLSSGGAVVWYENDGGGGTWTRKVAYTVASPINHLAASDVDQDGDPDLVAAVPSQDRVVWLQNDGDPGDDVAEWTATLVATLAEAAGVAVGDIDRDGDPDIAATSAVGTPGDDVRWYENDGTPLGPNWTSTLIEAGYSSPRRPALGDWDGDGSLDLAVPYHGDDSVRFYRNLNGDGTSWKVGASGSVAGPRSVELWDLDQDGDLDAVIGGDTVTWWENGEGARPMSTSITTAAEATAGDLDGDGDLDVAATSGATDKLFWYPNQISEFWLPTTARSYLGMVDGQVHEVLEIVAVHRGRAGDTDIELATLEFEVRDDLDGTVQNQHVITRIEEFSVWKDDGSGAFESGSDTLVATLGSDVGGGALPSTYTAAFTDGDVDLQFTQAASETYFVVMETKSTASSGTGPTSLQVVHLTESTSTAEDRDYDIPLSLAPEADTGSGLFQMVSTSGDSDGDGLSNALELANGSDSLNPDTDGDGLLDGAEVSTHGTDPVAPDTDGDGLDDGEEVDDYVTDPTDEDHDGDGYCDGPIKVGSCSFAGDNCPAVSNSLQLNSDGLPAGNDCQCGDVDNNGVVTAADRDMLRERLMGRSTPGFVADRCNVTGPSDGGVTDCTLLDISVIDRFVGGGGFESLENACDAYRGP